MVFIVATVLAMDPPWSNDLADLDPGFRSTVVRLIDALGNQGFHPVPGCTFRSADAQDLIYRVGNATQARGGQSCHNWMVDGKPASLAVDLWEGGLSAGIFLGLESSLAEQVPFLHALGKAAAAAGLPWGGNWKGHPSAWTSWGLGWDPAHVEDPRCN